jgi:NDP-sugar pyrophosphorylase family protein
MPNCRKNDQEYFDYLLNGNIQFIRHFNFEEFKFNEIIEKPEIYFSVNAGIYVFKKELIKYLRRNKKTEMNEFIEKLKNNKKNIKIYPIHEYWLDIGTPLKLKEFQKYLNDK